jgi:hypothetical protein
MTPDLIKRFAPTPYDATLAVNNVIVRVATNHPLVLDRLSLESGSSNQNNREKPAVHWRIVVEDNVDVVIDDSIAHRFSHDGLAFIRIGSRGFLASDQRAHFGISFVEHELIENERLFNLYYLPALLLMLREMEPAR